MHNTFFSCSSTHRLSFLFMPETTRPADIKKARTKLRSAVRTTAQGSVPSRTLLPFLSATGSVVKGKSYTDLRDLLKDEESRKSYWDFSGFFMSLIAYLATALEVIGQHFDYAARVLAEKNPGEDAPTWADTTAEELATLPLPSILARLGHAKLLQVASGHQDFRGLTAMFAGNAQALLALVDRLQRGSYAEIKTLWPEADAYFRRCRVEKTHATAAGMLSHLNVEVPLPRPPARVSAPPLTVPLIAPPQAPPATPYIPRLRAPGPSPGGRNRKRGRDEGWIPQHGDYCRPFNFQRCGNLKQKGHAFARPHRCLGCGQAHPLKECVCNCIYTLYTLLQLKLVFTQTVYLC